jgi:hypothetical protein
LVGRFFSEERTGRELFSTNSLPTPYSIINVLSLIRLSFFEILAGLNQQAALYHKERAACVSNVKYKIFYSLSFLFSLSIASRISVEN